MDHSVLALRDGARLWEWASSASGLSYLQRARQRIEQPGKWCKGQDVMSGRFSIVRALELEDDGGPGFESAMKALKAVTDGNPRKWNDRLWRTHASALRAMDRAMEIELKKR
jgi:hypothetical protein